MNRTEISEAAQAIAAMRGGRTRPKARPTVGAARRLRVLSNLEMAKAERGEYDLLGLSFAPAKDQRNGDELSSADIIRQIKTKAKTSAEIAEALGVEAQKVTNKTRTMERHKLIAKWKSGRVIRWIAL